MIKSSYEYLFYLFYKWTIWINGEKNYPIYYASLMLSLAVILNIFSLMMVVELFSIYAPLSFVVSRSKYFLVVFSVAILGLNYLYFSRKNRWVVIVEKFNKGGKGERALIKAGVYMAGSLFCLVALLFTLVSGDK